MYVHVYMGVGACLRLYTISMSLTCILVSMSMGTRMWVHVHVSTVYIQICKIWKREFFISEFFSFCVSVCALAHGGRRTTFESRLSSILGPRDPTLISGFGDCCSYPLSHLTSLLPFFFNGHSK